MEKTVDLLVIGAGAAGMSAASHGCRHGCSAALQRLPHHMLHAAAFLS